MRLGIHFFRRDLRIIDNVALNHCIEENDLLLPIYIFNPMQIEKKHNEYFSEKGFDLLKCFIYELSEEIPIHLEEGNPIKIIHKLINYIIELGKVTSITLYFNIDCTPFSIQRDTELFNMVEIANKNSKKIPVKIFAYVDHLLTGNTKTSITKISELHSVEEPYKKFSPYYNYYKKFIPTDPKTANINKIKFYRPDDGFHTDAIIANCKKSKSKFKYDRKNALECLKSDITYINTHDTPYISTLRISHYLKYGVISIREAYHNIKKNFTHKASRDAIIRQLYWRDFYTLIAWHYPQVLGYNYDNKKMHWSELKENSSLNIKYNNVKWSYDEKIIKAWKEGKTGFPIVDAGMRQLVETGYMHNRVRLITASFLTKICGIDWRIGEQWFAQHLIDYDPIINNGNWQWVAGGGADSQPFFRVFNPWLQQAKFDKDALYIKQYLPELKNIDAKKIHKLEIIGDLYIKQIVDYSEIKEITLEKYRAIFKD